MEGTRGQSVSMRNDQTGHKTGPPPDGPFPVDSLLEQRLECILTGLCWDRRDKQHR